MTKNQYIILFIALGIAAIVIGIIIYNTVIKEDKDGIPKYISTCNSFPNDNILVPAAYYTIPSIGITKQFSGGQVRTEKECKQNCTNVTDCIGYLYNAGQCNLITDASQIKNAKFYCKDGAGVGEIATFAKQYRKLVPEYIVGHGYFKENRLPSPTPQAPGSIAPCLTLRQLSNNAQNTGLYAEKIWESKSYKIPELTGLDMNNYSEHTPCVSYCSSLGSYELPWCYTKMPPASNAPEDNTNSQWGFCTYGCTGYDCYSENQSWTLPKSLNVPCGIDCPDKGILDQRCGSCELCTGLSTCELISPASWSPARRSNHYCLYPGSPFKDKCCTETNRCSTKMDNPSPADMAKLKDVSSQKYREKRNNLVLDTTSSSVKEVKYEYITNDNLANVCQNDINCDLPISSSQPWCNGENADDYIIGIRNPNQKLDNDYGKCSPTASAPNTLCCYYGKSPSWSTLSPSGFDSWWSVDTAPFKPITNVSRTCRTKCTDLNPTDPPNPLDNKWCITDPLYPAAELEGSPITFPLVNKDFITSGDNVDRSFWDWGFCKDGYECENKYIVSPSGQTNNIYPEITGI